MRHKLPLLSLVLATLFVYLFHGEGIGVNVLIFELAALIILWLADRPHIGLLGGVALGGTLLSAVFMAVHGSAFCLWVNIISVITLAGVMLAPHLNALNHSILLGIAHMFAAQRAFLRNLNNGSVGRKVLGLHRRTIAGLLAVAGISWLFSLLYQASNPHFDRLVADIGVAMAEWFGQVDIAILGTFLLGLTVSNVLLLRTRNESLLQWMARSHDELFRRRQRSGRVILGLRYELRTGVLLLGVLNLLLLLANILDVKHVWLGFTFNGQYLKQFVHEGTILLILSILLGAGIVLYFFRANQNFHHGNRILKILAYVWLAQNAILAASVAMRNFWYIQHYALAYKRIGVIFFIVACVIGLYLVFGKVRDRRSKHYVIRWQALSIYGILLLVACVDWDVVITRYNFNARDRAFVHLDYLATLSDKALPWLIQDPRTLEQIDLQNQEILSDMGTFDRSLYMLPSAYAQTIDQRKDRFLSEHSSGSWKSRTLAHSKAYRLLNTDAAGTE
jgi:hypothetical protein